MRVKSGRPVGRPLSSMSVVRLFLGEALLGRGGAFRVGARVGGVDAIGAGLAVDVVVDLALLAVLHHNAGQALQLRIVEGLETGIRLHLADELVGVGATAARSGAECQRQRDAQTGDGPASGNCTYLGTHLIFSLWW